MRITKSQAKALVSVAVLRETINEIVRNNYGRYPTPGELADVMEWVAKAALKIRNDLLFAENGSAVKRLLKTPREPSRKHGRKS